MHVVECRDLQVRYGSRVVLDRVGFRLRPGITCLLGRNGAGKTSLFRVLCGIIAPSRGSVRTLGADPSQQPGHRQAIGYLTHRPSLYDRLSIEQNLAFWARVLGLPPSDARRQVHALATRLGFADRLHQRAGTLSRGQQQRVAIARLLLARPALLLLDEPTTGLDALAARELHDFVRELAREGVSAVYATHALDEAAALGDQFLLVAGGSARLLDDEAAEAGPPHGGGVVLKVSGPAEALLQGGPLPFEREGELHVVHAPSIAAIQPLVARLAQGSCQVVAIEQPASLEGRLLRQLAQME